MKCFVASPLGREDVDELYDKAIRPLLKELKLQPIRIDRVEHNDDLDDKIVQLLNESDICIADLTYARPSVYYEAGYAFASGKPVIYIARKDHFDAKANDLPGNLRIHFDLQMKNIVPWIRADQPFKERLRRRLVQQLKPLRAKERRALQSGIAEREFAASSQREKLLTIAQKALDLLRRHQFKRVIIGQIQYPQFHMMRRFDRAFNHQANVRVYPSISKTILRDLRSDPALYLAYTTMQEDKRTQKFAFCLLLVALDPVRDRLVSEIFPSYRRVARNIFTMQESYHDKPATYSIGIVDSVRSVSDFADRYVSTLQQLGYL